MLRHAPILAEDVQPGDQLTTPDSLTTRTVEQVKVWADNSVVITYRTDPFQSWALLTQRGNHVHIVDAEGEIHPLEDQLATVRVPRRVLLDLLAWIEDGEGPDEWDTEAQAALAHVSLLAHTTQ
jgi:hypothetical protein